MDDVEVEVDGEVVVDIVPPVGGLVLRVVGGPPVGGGVLEAVASRAVWRWGRGQRHWDL